MLISIQYPFADARPFIDADGGRLPLPRWTAPDTETDFVRAFGGVTVRSRSGASLAGEQHHCDARWAVRFGLPGLGPHRRCAFRRFYSDGNVLAKFEIGIARDVASGPLPVTEQIDAIHEQLACVPAVDALARPLGELGPALARAYLRTSTAHRYAAAPESWWVRPGAPVTLAMYRAEDHLQLPAEITPVRTSRDQRSVTVAHAWHQFRGKLRRVWFLGYQPADYALARQLRVDLVRLHCEHHALQSILRHIARGALLPRPRSERSDRLQRYLSDAITTITRLRCPRRSAIGEASCQLVDAAASELLDEETASLAADLELQLTRLDVRPNIRRKVGVYTARAGQSTQPTAAPASPPATRAVGGARRGNVIAFLAANPAGTSRLLLDEECARIERELCMTAARDEFELCSRWAVTVDEMMRHLAALDPTVIHFSGHGCAESVDDREPNRQAMRDIANASGGGIYLEDEHRQPHCVSGQAMAQMIASAAPSTRVVVLNACFSDNVAGPLCSTVDCVVGMRGAVDDRAAQSFAVAFYRALGNRCSVGNAVHQASATIAAKHPGYEHLPMHRTRGGISADQMILAPRPSEHETGELERHRLLRSTGDMALPLRSLS
jgi:hypothetical protein